MAQHPTPKDILLGINSGAAEFLETPLSSLKLRNLWQHTVRKMMSNMGVSTWPQQYRDGQAMACDYKRSGMTSGFFRPSKPIVLVCLIILWVDGLHVRIPGRQ